VKAFTEKIPFFSNFKSFSKPEKKSVKTLKSYLKRVEILF